MTEACHLFGDLISALLSRTAPPCLEDPTPAFDRPDDPLRYPAAFLVSLVGKRHPRYEEAVLVLAESSHLAEFLSRERKRVVAEIETRAADEPAFLAALRSASTVGTDTPSSAAFESMWAVTFPEGVDVRNDWSGAVERLRRRRLVEVEALNPDPIVDPIAEVLLTSNVLVALGADAGPPRYWYDHPIPIDAKPETSELAHGLRSINAAVGFELSRHTEWSGPATVVLSLSSTHEPPSAEEGSLVHRVLSSIEPLPNLRVFCFDEQLSRRLWEEVICAVPVPGHSPPTSNPRPVFGVSGPYGRHYSFLKALAPLWAICIDPRVRGTFKFDLDQAFPQEQLVAETGQTALEHLTTGLWGARARATTGERIDLSLLAGGLVNQADTEKSIFTPDVPRKQPETAEHAIFFSPLVQALSTEAEIVTRADQLDDGVAQERIHVTGGTSGVLVAGLRRWRLFSPSFVGRAEDQAYLISALHNTEDRPGYLHEPGFVMRHDKAEIIPDVIGSSTDDNHIGDLVRTRLFSTYGAGHKSLLDPFTGCFISQIPITVTALRFAVHALESAEAADHYLTTGARRLGDADATVSSMAEATNEERKQWDFFYGALEALEAGLRSGESWAFRIRDSATAIINAAAVS